MGVNLPEILVHDRECAETLFALARLQFAAFERLSALAFNANKEAFEDGVAHTRSMLNARDAREWVEFSMAFPQPLLHKSLAHWRSMFDVAVQSQDEIARLLESQADSCKEILASLFAGPGKAAAPEPSLIALKAALAAAGWSCEGLRIFSNLAGNLAETGFTSAMKSLKGR